MEEWTVHYEDALQQANPDARTRDAIVAWVLLCTIGPPEDGFPLKVYPELPMEDDFWEAPVHGTTLIARYLIANDRERLIIVKDFS